MDGSMMDYTGSFTNNVPTAGAGSPSGVVPTPVESIEPALVHLQPRERLSLLGGSGFGLRERVLEEVGYGRYAEERAIASSRRLAEQRL